MGRRGLLSALLLTAALFCAMPGLFRSLDAGDENRMDQRLRPAQSRTLTLWLLDGGMGDDRLLRALCAAFEKEEKGVRVFLRGADAAELDAPGAVWPDGVFYTAGTVVNPEKYFLPLSGLEGPPESVLGSGQSGGAQYAAPLWLSPGVLSLPDLWLAEGATPPPDSFFGLSTPAPTVGPPALSWEELPWRRLLAENGLWIREGICLSQALFVCPSALREELIASAALGGKPVKGAARAWTLREHCATVKAGEALSALPLLPCAAVETRYLSLLTDSADTRALLAFFTGREAGQAAQAACFLSAFPGGQAAGAAQADAQAAYEEGCFAPNAFAHAKEELAALCKDGFLRGIDPVETLLRLR